MVVAGAEVGAEAGMTTKQPSPLAGRIDTAGWSRLTRQQEYGGMLGPWKRVWFK